MEYGGTTFQEDGESITRYGNGGTTSYTYNDNYGTFSSYAESNATFSSSTYSQYNGANGSGSGTLNAPEYYTYDSYYSTEYADYGRTTTSSFTSDIITGTVDTSSRLVNSTSTAVDTFNTPLPKRLTHTPLPPTRMTQRLGAC